MTYNFKIHHVHLEKFQFVVKRWDLDDYLVMLKVSKY